MVRFVHRQLLARCLCAVMLMVAVLPAFSRAWAASQGGDWIEICSAQGSRWVQLDVQALAPGDAQDGKSSDAGQFRPMADTCAACLLQAQAGLPPPDAMAWRLPERFAERPVAFLQAPRLLSVWRHALSRGPPGLSA